ncbi:sensor histidine kinase [Spirosoma flavum]|uniref:Sensor histidine kinase n=1 Tax=Spirosoma flavum TaxID=2048557 RepID=A0ABW6AKD4_9BACT
MEKGSLKQALAGLEQYVWLRHGAFWVIYTLFLTWYILQMKLINQPLLALRDALLFLGLFMVATYSLLYGVLAPYWQGETRQLGWRLAGWLMGCLGLHYGFRYSILHPMRAGYQVPTNADFFNTFSAGTYILMIATAALATISKLLRHWYHQEVANQRLLAENVTAELRLLKAQVHPHFLFNTLNNLYALTLKQSDQATDVVGRLRGLWHYMTQECNQAQIPLTTEVRVLQHYIQLEQLRYGDRLRVEVSIQGALADYQLPPLLLLPFVENAFKHGSAQQLGKAQITLQLWVEAGQLSFQLTNTRTIRPPEGDKPGGIGLQNVRQRLSLLYASAYQLAIESHPTKFSVCLTFPLQAR